MKAKISLPQFLWMLFPYFVYGQQIIEPQQADPFSVTGKKIEVYTTANNTNFRLSLTDTLQFVKAEQPKETDIGVFVNPEVSFQTIIGFGGAITDASAEVYNKMPVEKQKNFLNLYYDTSKGIAYNLARTTIHSCDFSSESYTYINEGDSALLSFSISHDKPFRIPLIHEAIKTTNGKLLIYASPWSPPAFMKSNNSLLKGGKLLPQYYSAWAKYFTHFIHAYEKEGIPIWGISIQNEPMAVQTWESCIFSAEEERDFLKFNLGPEMAKASLSDVKIIVWDHNRDLMTHRANIIFNDPEASKYAWGLGFHWYETWTGGQPMFENVERVHESFPTKNLIFTEGCNEKFNPQKYSFWPNAERYGYSMINDLNNGIVAWTDWNILLDENGGPNHVGNYCFAPVHYDLTADSLIITPAFYYIGHFSKFIQRGAKRISASTSRSNLQSTSFINPDKKIVTVVLNRTDDSIEYSYFFGLGEAVVTIPPHAIQTLVH